jgi:hypothetical protein
MVRFWRFIGIDETPIVLAFSKFLAKKANSFLREPILVRGARSTSPQGVPNAIFEVKTTKKINNYRLFRQTGPSPDRGSVARVDANIAVAINAWRSVATLTTEEISGGRMVVRNLHACATKQALYY